MGRVKIVSFNANGIRAAAKKGFFDWFYSLDADVLCIQETKSQEHQLQDEVFTHPSYQRFFFDALKPGYSGVAIYTRLSPERCLKGLGFPLADTEGRYIEIQMGALSIASLYLPSGSSGEVRQAAKFAFMTEYQKILYAGLTAGRQYIICGDWNIVHKEIDIKNWLGNQKNSGCLPEERAWLDLLFESWGWIDAFRVLNHDKDQYTWWSQRTGAWARNVGWRIDYQVISPGLKDKIKHVSIYRGQQFSDHAPLIIEYANLIKARG